MPFTFFAWIASFLYGVETIVGKLTSKHAIQNPWLFNFLWSGFILLFTVPLALFNHAGFPAHWEAILIVSVFYALSNLFFMIVLKFFDVSALVPLYNLKIAFTALLAIPILGEVLTASQYVLIGIMFFAGIFVTLDEKWSMRSFFRRGILIALIGVMCTTLWGITVNLALKTNGFWEVAFWVPLIAQCFFLVTIPFFKKEIRSISRKQFLSVVLMALAAMVGTLAANRAYADNASITAVILAIPFSMIMAFGFSVFAPKLLEKHTLKVYAIRFAGVAVMIVCGLVLSK